MIKSYYFGFLAEYLVIIYYFFSGYNIVKHRFKTNLGEVDIICSKNNQLVFIEVKARTLYQEEVLTNKQISRINNAAKLFMAKNYKLQNFDVRFDLVNFSFNKGIKIIKNAW